MVDAVHMNNVIEENKKETEMFKIDLRQNKRKRELDIYEMQQALEDAQKLDLKKDEDYIREGHTPVID